MIVERHQRQVYQLCYRFVGNHEDASDLAQDVFMRAYRGLRGFKGTPSFGTWLYRIGVNVCLNRVSLKTPRSEAIDERTLPASTAERPDVTVMRQERAQEVRAAIAKLPTEAARDVDPARSITSCRTRRLPAILGSSVGAVKANFFHALANLKKLLR